MCIYIYKIKIKTYLSYQELTAMNGPEEQPMTIYSGQFLVSSVSTAIQVVLGWMLTSRVFRLRRLQRYAPCKQHWSVFFAKAAIFHTTARLRTSMARYSVHTSSDDLDRISRSQRPRKSPNESCIIWLSSDLT